MRDRTRKYILAVYLAAVIVGIGLARTYWQQLLGLLPSTLAQGQPASWHLLACMAAFAAVLAVTVFFSSPTNPLFYLASGYYFGLVYGTAIAALATVIGSGAAFLLFRRTIKPRRAGRELDANIFLTLCLLRCSPWFPAPLVSAFCGATRVRPGVFVASTFFGTLPLILAYTLTASRLRGPITLSILYSPEIVTALTVLGAVSAIGCLRPVRHVISYLKGITQVRPAEAE